MTWPHATEIVRKGVGTGIPVGLLSAGVDMGEWPVIVGGLLIGLMARWAMRLATGDVATWRVLHIDLLMLAMNALLAREFGSLFDLHGVKLAIEAGLFSASATTAFAKLYKRFEKEQTESGAGLIHEVGATVDHSAPATIRIVDRDTPSTPPEILVDEIKKQKASPHDAEIQRLLRRLYNLEGGRDEN